MICTRQLSLHSMTKCDALLTVCFSKFLNDTKYNKLFPISSKSANSPKEIIMTSIILTQWVDIYLYSNKITEQVYDNS